MRRGEYILRRLGLASLVIIGVSILTFYVAQILPGDPARTWASQAKPEQLEEIRHQLGLDLPIHQQYIRYINRVLHGDLGVSIMTHRDIAGDLQVFFPATLELVTFATLLAIIIGIPVGVIAGSMRNRWFDHLSRVFSIAGTSMPAYWLGLVLLLFISGKLGLLPLSARVDREVLLYHPIQPITGTFLVDSLLTGNWIGFRSAILHIILPGLTLALYPIGLLVRMTRSNLIEVLGEKYILAARAAGLPRRTVLFTLALRNTLAPILNMIGLMFVNALTMAIVVEVIFSWPGMGNYVMSAVLSSDFPVIMAVTLIVTVFYVAINLAIDLLQSMIDPRVVLE